MPGRSARDEDRRRYLGHDAELEPVDRERVVRLADLLAGQRGAQEPHGVAHLLVGLVERDVVPPLDDHVRRRADAEHEPAGRGVGQRRHALRQRGRPAGERRHDRGAQTQRRRPHRGERERRERVGAVRLARPHVGVAELDQLGEPRPAARAAAPRRRGWSCQVGSRSAPHRRWFRVSARGRPGPGPVASHDRTIVDWLAVASNVPSSAHNSTVPVPNPSATASMRMSSSTHSVGTTCTIRKVLSRLLPPPHHARAPVRCRTARSRRGWRASRPSSRAGPGCVPTTRSVRRSSGLPSRSAQSRAFARRTSVRLMIDSSPGIRSVR